MTAAETGAERYELIDRVAVGGMAEVYRAKAFGAHGFEKTLAIKRILPELAEQPEFEDRFISEAKLAVTLAHANIVQVLDFGRFAGSLFIAMEYVDGLDLAAVLKWEKEHDRRIPLAAAFQIAIDICRGLDFAHKQNVIHRDVSPSNILLSKAGEVKIADFGIAQAASKRSGRGPGWKKIMGKWRYMSPEQTRGEPLTIQSDLFSAASVLFEVFTGDKLFPGDDAKTITENIETMAIPSAVVRREELPPEVDQVLADALARDSRDRPATAAVMVRELTRISYANNLVATPDEVAAVIQEIASEVDSAGRKGLKLDDLIRAQLGQGGVSSHTEESRQTAVGEGEGSVVVKKSVDADGITVFQLDRETIAAVPSAIRTGRSTGMQAAIVSEDDDGGDTPGRKKMLALGLAVAGIAGLGLLGVLLLSSGPRPMVAAGGDAAEAPVAETKLRIDSIPPGASVFINEKSSGETTPATVVVEPDREAVVRLELDGYRTWEDAHVTAGLGETLRLRPKLTARQATLEVTTNPPGVAVLIDGENVGKSPFRRTDLEPGEHRLVLTKSGYRPTELTVELTEGKPFRVDQTLRPSVEFGTINLHIDEGWADVYLKGKKIGRAPVKGLRLPVGRHRLKLSNPATNKEQTLVVDVVAGQAAYYRTKM